MAGITQPLEFRKFLTCAPKVGLDGIPFLDGILLVLFVALNTSPFIIAPGTEIELPKSMAMASHSGTPSAVLTVDRNQLYFFEGTKLSPLTLERHLSQFVEEWYLNPDHDHPTLLIKADVSISTRMLFHLMDLAREAGFVRVNLAAEPGRIAQDTENWDEGVEGDFGP